LCPRPGPGQRKAGQRDRAGRRFAAAAEIVGIWFFVGRQKGGFRSNMSGNIERKSFFWVDIALGQKNILLSSSSSLERTDEQENGR
jgi:hypothetical protein